VFEGEKEIEESSDRILFIKKQIKEIAKETAKVVGY
jgi:hypothetical protein